MTDHDRKEFAKLCALMSQAFDKSMSKVLIGVYFEALRDFTIEQVASAVNQAVQTQKFLPKVAELRQLIEGAAEDRAAMAWAAFLDATADGGQASVQFTDRAMAAAMDAVFGGWVQACRLLAAGWVTGRGDNEGGCSDEMLAHYQKSFLRQYVAALNNRREVELYRPGLSEMSLRERGAAWSGRMPTLDQSVIYVGAGKAVTLQLTFDVAQGRLTDDSQALLNAGWERALALAASRRRQLKEASRKALPPAPAGERVTLDEVDEISAAIVILAGKQRMPQVENVAEAQAEAQEMAIVDQSGDGPNFEAGN